MTEPAELLMVNPPKRRTAADICRLFSLKPPAFELLEPGLSPLKYFQRLVEAGHLADARRLLAHGIRPESAVWWAALCLQESLARKPFDTDAERAAFTAVGNWLVSPTESNRRLAEEAGWAARSSTAAGILALAVYLSGGSISRPGLPEVQAEPHLCGRLCGVVVYLASVRSDPANYKQRLRQYLQIGIEVARGLNPPPAWIAEPGPIVPKSRFVSVGLDALPSGVRSLVESAMVSLEGRSGETLFHHSSGSTPGGED